MVKYMPVAIQGLNGLTVHQCSSIIACQKILCIGVYTLANLIPRLSSKQSKGGEPGTLHHVSIITASQVKRSWNSG